MPPTPENTAVEAFLAANVITEGSHVLIGSCNCTPDGTGAYATLGDLTGEFTVACEHKQTHTWAQVAVAAELKAYKTKKKMKALLSHFTTTRHYLPGIQPLGVRTMGEEGDDDNDDDDEDEGPGDSDQSQSLVVYDAVAALARRPPDRHKPAIVLSDPIRGGANEYAQEWAVNLLHAANWALRNAPRLVIDGGNILAAVHRRDSQHLHRALAAALPNYLPTFLLTFSPVAAELLSRAIANPAYMGDVQNAADAGGVRLPIPHPNATQVHRHHRTAPLAIPPATNETAEEVARLRRRRRLLRGG